MHARIGMLRALNADKPRVFKESKRHHWGRALSVVAATMALAFLRTPSPAASKPRRAGQVGSITRWGYASGALARVAGDLWQGKGESIDQPTSPRLRQHR